MKNYSFFIKVISMAVIIAILYHYQTIASERAAETAENEAKIAEVEDYNRQIQEENARRESAANSENNANEPEQTEALYYKDGTYEGTGTGYGGPIKISVTIEHDVFTDFQVLSHDGEDPAYYSLAESLIDEVLQEQTDEIDAASGATFSSHGILEALGNALDEAVNE